MVVRQVKDDDTQVRIYVKGAPEYILDLCSETFDYNMQQKELDDDDKENISVRVVSQGMA